MVEAEAGEYLNVETSHDGDIVVIVDKPYKDTVERNGEKVIVDNIPIELNGKKLKYTPGRKATKLFVTAWGKEMDNWVGKKFQVTHKEIEAFGKEMTVIRPKLITEEKV